jgi:hypothetical protein
VTEIPDLEEGVLLNQAKCIYGLPALRALALIPRSEMSSPVLAIIDIFLSTNPVFSCWVKVFGLLDKGCRPSLKPQLVGSVGSRANPIRVALFLY